MFPNPAALFGSPLFGAIGLGAFMYGKKMVLYKPMAIGFVLMAYPYFVPQTWLMYTIGCGLCLALYLVRDQPRTGKGTMNTTVLETMLTCPHCGFVAQETMFTDACLYFYECSNCKTLLRPNRGDCCVFCSFGSVKCPPIQEKHTCCG